jgi:hypothetical protein
MISVAMTSIVLGIVRNAWAKGSIAKHTAYFDNVILFVFVITVVLVMKSLRGRR